MTESDPDPPRDPRAWAKPLLLVAIALVLAWPVWVAKHPRPPAAQATPPPHPTPPSTLGETASLLPIVFEDVPDPNAIKHFILHLPIKVRAGVHVEPKRFVIHVLFYDVLNGEKIAQTSANVTCHWATSPADWIHADTEELVAEYDLPKPSPDAGPTGNRKYYGYLVRVYYDEHLQAATAQPKQLGRQYPAPSVLPRSVVPEVEHPALAADGFAPGATLALLPITSEDLADENSLQHLRLRIPIKARSKARVEVQEIVVHVLFYDLVDGQSVVQTIGHVTYHWANSPANWLNSDTETLSAEYQLTRPEVSTAAPPEDRKYYGYIVRVYYQQRLQSAAGLPKGLMEQYPAPATLPASQ